LMVIQKSREGKIAGRPTGKKALERKIWGKERRPKRNDKRGTGWRGKNECAGKGKKYPAAFFLSRGGTEIFVQELDLAGGGGRWGGEIN